MEAYDLEQYATAILHYRYRAHGERHYLAYVANASIIIWKLPNGNMDMDTL